MKKSLVALAVLAASGVASAQNVTIYGVVDLWFGSQKAFNAAGTAANVSQTRVDSGGVSGNRYGFTGSEDLGGGLKANFLLEQGFNTDTGTATAGQAFSRQAYVGFSGGFGEVKFGKPWTAYDDISGIANAVFDSALSANNNVFASTGYNANPGNTVYYATPNFDGVSGAFSYSFGENKTATLSASSVTAFHIKYEGGPLYVGAAYQAEKQQGGGRTAKYTRLNATYDLGMAKLLAGYGRVANQNAADEKTTEWTIGADFPVSDALTLSAGYARSKDNTTAGGEKRTGYGIGASYSLSKRTSFYAGYQTSKEKAAGLADGKGRLYAVGIRHAF